MRLVAIAAMSLLLAAPDALAFCRTMTCDQIETTPNCTGAKVNGCTSEGIPIAWPDTCVSSSVSAQGSAAQNIKADTLRAIVSDAFQKWTTVDCGSGAHPNFAVDMFPNVNCPNVWAQKDYNPEGPNYNVWTFIDSNWPLGTSADGTLALTTVSFPTTGTKVGEIYDVDVAINSDAEHQFATNLNSSSYDFPSVITHEAGHFLGIAHTQLSDRTITMYPSIDTGEIRVLSPDDIAAICAIYPPGTLDPSCDPEPRHGFSTECTFADSSCNCAIGFGRWGKQSGKFGALLTTIIGMMALIRRRKIPGS